MNTPVHAVDAVLGPTDGFTLCHWSTGGKMPRHAAVCQQKQEQEDCEPVNMNVNSAGCWNTWKKQSSVRTEMHSTCLFDRRDSHNLTRPSSVSQFFACLVLLFACEVAAGIWGFMHKDTVRLQTHTGGWNMWGGTGCLEPKLNLKKTFYTFKASNEIF